MSKEQDKLLRRKEIEVAKYINALRRHKEVEDGEAAESILLKLRDAFDGLEDLHVVHCETITEDAKVKERQAWFNKIEKDYITNVKEVRNWLKSELMTVNHKGRKGLDSESCSFLRLINAPKIELDVFNGDPLRYQVFIALFDEAVDKCTELDGSAKLARLLQYCGGDAKRSIENCVLIGGSEGYKKAKEILERRFGNPHLVANSVISHLTNGKNIIEMTGVQQLADDASAAYTTLKKLNMLGEVESQQTLLNIIQRLPSSIVNKWRKKALKMKQEEDSYPKFEHLVDFLTLVATEINDPVYGEARLSSSVLQATVTTHCASVRCPLCAGDHRLYRCTQYRSLTHTKRLELAARKKVCFNCLIPGHRSNYCRLASFCKVPGCKYKHSSLLHDDSKKASDNEMSQVNNACNDISITAYVPMVPVSLNNKLTVLALLDSGSTNTFVTRTLADKLGLNGKSITYNVNTISDKRNVSSKVVNLSVTSPNSADRFQLKDVIIVNDIPANLPKYTITTDNYPHLKGLNFDRLQTTAKAEILIGTDHASLLKPLEVSTGCDSRSPYAVRTVLGWSLYGPDKT